jgi:hypothetical protein
MKNLFRFCQSHSQRPSQTNFFLGLLVIVLAFGITLNTLLDVDCLPIQAATCCCNSDTTTQNGVQADTCTHCTERLPVLIADNRSAISSENLPFHSSHGRAFSALLTERPPISA